jgi:manganese transport protein
MLYIAIGILGATVMPHNLYLHSSHRPGRGATSIRTRARRKAIRFATIDSSVALMSALFINAAILIVARGRVSRHAVRIVADISDAYKLLSPLLGTTAAGILFAVALLCSGQNATLTGTLAGQNRDGRVRQHPAASRGFGRLITRLVAIVPAIIVVSLYGERGTGALLVLSQVVLSLQLPFAVFPLVSFTSDRHKMGALVAPMWMRIWHGRSRLSLPP